jgi:hypothetical protein
MTLNCCTIEARACSTASTNSLVVAQILIAEYEVIHRTIAAGYIVEWLKD